MSSSSPSVPSSPHSFNSSSVSPSLAPVTESEYDFDFNLDLDVDVDTVVKEKDRLELEEEEGRLEEERQNIGKEAEEKARNVTVMQSDFEERYARLQRLLEKSTVYASLLKEQMDNAKRKAARIAARANDVRIHEASGMTKQGDGRHTVEDEFVQPRLVTGTNLKPYQLEGVAWMIGLHQNGISGILADEMGLGKTLQTIAFAAHLRDAHVRGPFLVICPLSVLWNWKEEVERFAPEIPVCVYHGTPAERVELRKTVLTPGDDAFVAPSAHSGNARADIHSEQPGGPKKRGGKGRKTTKASSSAARKKSSRAGPATKSQPSTSAFVSQTDAESNKQADQADHQGPPPALPYPLLLTTPAVFMRDAPVLSQHFRSQREWSGFSYVVVDEGHRLKNFDCALMRALKRLEAECGVGGRLVLTGTPVQNNLAELWSLLNFILPEIFDDLEMFEEWFTLSSMDSVLSSERMAGLVNTLHGILRPFILRRMKADVLGASGDTAGLPPKKEYVLYAPLSVRQRVIYDAVLSGGLRAWLVKQGMHQPSDTSAPAKRRRGIRAELGDEEMDVDFDAPRQLRKKRKKVGNVDEEGDDEYFSRVEKDAEDSRRWVKEGGLEEEMEEGRKWQEKNNIKRVNNMRLQNTVMQLRKVCCHPLLFDVNDPLSPSALSKESPEDIVKASGKMLLLDRLLDELFRRKHKVLLFSQFVMMLDIIEEWALETKKWQICRIDGSTPVTERRSEMERFQKGGDAPGSPQLFLLSTRAGGLGINLTAADTVIFYDQDWNPQMDVQAQDRAHRIGQTKPVLIFRLVTAHTIEEKIMQRAGDKRKLEALVMAKGKFKTPTATGAGRSTMAEMAAELMQLEGEEIDVVSEAHGGAQLLSDADLDVLLDRRPEVFSGRGKGWKRDGAKVKESREEDKKRTAFAVFEGRVEGDGDVLAGMIGGEGS